MPHPAPAVRLAGAALVVILASGYIVARYVAPHAEPLTFLSLRFAATALAMGVIAVAARAPWPTSVREWRDIAIAGALLQGVMLSGVFWSVRHGLPAGVCALILALQPVLTGLLAGPFLGERVTARAWAGLGAGLVGAGMVLAPRIAGDDALPPAAILAAGCGLVAISIGTLWQKKTGQTGDLRVNVTIQFLAAFVLVTPLALLVEDLHFDGAGELWIAMAWSVLGTSAAGILLMLWLLRRMQVSAMSALFYLVPVTAAAMTWLVFGETLTPVQILGMVIAVAGVWLANRAPRAVPTRPAAAPPQ
ncbi:peptide ABC transporter ATP-binding protein [Camelimonas fluminis]|uniref:DMT family transporter n=1 Tax=Camelimonas fluminis TaxID=1576911 RepID=A0ABV7UKF9_9HYPH|nr:DMT family transporter [Camelimonas fluminis]GHE55324.1 peptide ABC transporter ATP-binding protein [Camelimonas fluminis]